MKPRNLLLYIFPVLLSFGLLACSSGKWQGFNRDSLEAQETIDQDHYEKEKQLREKIVQQLPVSEVHWSNSHNGVPFRNVWAGRDQVYAELENNQLWAIDRTSGKTRWFYSLTHPIEYAPATVHGVPERRSELEQQLQNIQESISTEKGQLNPDQKKISELESQRRNVKSRLSELERVDRIYVLEKGNELHTINRKHGASIPNIPTTTTLDFTPSASPTATRDLILIPGFEDHRIHFLSTSTFISELTFSAAGLISSEPRADGQQYFFSSLDGNLYEYNSAEGNITTILHSPAPIHISPIIHEDRLFIASEDMQVYSIDRSSGNIVWDLHLETPVTKELILKPPNLYVKPENRGLLSININTGKQQWEVSSCTKFLLRSDDRTYCTDQEEDVIVSVSDQGEVLKTYNVQFADFLLTNTESSMFVLGTRSGFIFAAEEDPMPSPYR